MTDKEKIRAEVEMRLSHHLAFSGKFKGFKSMADEDKAILSFIDSLPEGLAKFKIGDTIRPKGSKAEYTITSISGGCYHGKGWGLPIGAEKDYELVESTEDVDAQINSQNEAIKQLNRALNSMEHGGHLPLDEDRMVPNEEIDAMAEEISKDCEDEIDRQFEEIVDKHLYGKKPEMVDIDDLPLDACNIQYASIDGAIKAHAEDYSFNIESELFQQLTPEQQEMWRKEIEQAVLSGAYSGLNLARDERYEENRQEESVSEELKDEIHNRWEDYPHIKWPKCPYKDFKNIACHFANWQKKIDADLGSPAYERGYCDGRAFEAKRFQNGITQEDYNLAKAAAYEAGKQVMKQQMMKDAVEGEITKISPNDHLRVVSDVLPLKDESEWETRVKLIIIKED